MKTFDELCNELGISQKVRDEHYVNPLSLLISEEFNRKEHRFGPPLNEEDYRDRALTRAIKSKVSFHSETNSLSNLAERILTVTCPVCKSEMKPDGFGGSGRATTVSYRCKCEVKISLTFANDAIGVSFPKEE